MDPVRSQQSDQTESLVKFPPPRMSELVESGIQDQSALLDPVEPATLVAVPVDPYVVHCQWEVVPADIERAKRALGVSDNEYWPVLQFYDVTDAAQDETVRRPSFSADVKLGAQNWYVRSCSPDRTYQADLALKGEDGRLAVIASSNRVQTPPSAPSTYVDNHWLPIRPAPWTPQHAVTPRLPIDMSADVRNQLAAIYGEPQGEILEPRQVQLQLEPQPPSDRGQEAHGEMDAYEVSRKTETLAPSAPCRVPIDMGEEVRTLLGQLFQGLKDAPLVLTGDPLSEERHYMQNPGRTPEAVSFEMKRNAVVDLTELNERSFASGISSRTK